MPSPSNKPEQSPDNLPFENLDQTQPSHEKVREIISDLESLKNEGENSERSYLAALLLQAEDVLTFSEPVLSAYVTKNLSELMPQAVGYLEPDRLAGVKTVLSDLFLCSGDTQQARKWGWEASQSKVVSVEIEIEGIRGFLRSTWGDCTEETKQRVDSVLMRAQELTDKCIAEDRVDSILSLAYEMQSILESQQRFFHPTAFALKVIDALENLPSVDNFRLNKLRLECAKLLCKGESMTFPEEFDGSTAEKLLNQALAHFKSEDYAKTPQAPLLVVDCCQSLADIHCHRDNNEEMSRCSQQAYDHCIVHILPRMDEQESVMQEDVQCIFDTLIYHAETQLELNRYHSSEEICNSGLKIADRFSEAGLYLASILSVKAQAVIGLAGEPHQIFEERIALFEMADECFSKAADVFDYAMNERNFLAGGECYYRWAHCHIDLADLVAPGEDRDVHITNAIDHLNSALDYFNQVEVGAAHWLMNTATDLANLYEQIHEYGLAEELQTKAESYGAELP